MIRLPAGTPRYLLLHTSEIERNTERAKAGSPVAVVVEIDPESRSGFRIVHGYNVLAVGAVSLHYSQRTPLFKVRMAPGEEDTPIYAAYGTTDEVLVAESHDEPLVIEEEPQPPQPEKKAKK